MNEVRRVTGCLSRREAIDQLRDMARTLTNMGRPERVGLRKWGRGWAVFLYLYPASGNASG